MSNRYSLGSRILTALTVFAVFGLGVWAAERLIEAGDPDLLWRDPESGDDGLKFYRFDPVFGLFHKPSFRGEYQGVAYETNSRGLRGAELPYERTSGRPRVALLGDSLVWGFGVTAGGTLGDALARALPGTEIVNLGVAGYGTGQELILLQHEGLRYAPDHVLLVFTLANDVEDTWYPDSAGSYPANLFSLDAGGLRVHRFEVSARERLGLWLAHNSFVVAWFAQGLRGSDAAPSADSGVGRSNRARLEQIQPDLSRYQGLDYLEPPELEPPELEPPELEPPGLGDPPRPGSGSSPIRYARRGGRLQPSPLNHYKVELVKQLLLEMARVSRESGATFNVALAPHAAELDAPFADPLAAELRRFLAEAGIPALDLLPALRASALPARRLFVDPLHFSRAGNDVVAAAIATTISPGLQP